MSKQKARERNYSKLRKEFLKANPICKVRGISCTGKATDIHHKAGRGELYLYTPYWLSVCRNCHQWVELNPIRAKELGFSISRLNN